MASSWYQPPKRKVFISYHHGGDQYYYDAFSSAFCSNLEILTDRSLDRARDSDNSAYIMRYIRENHLTGASTIIILCGLETPLRKFVDWEIMAGLGQQMSLVGVKLPELPIIGDGCNKPARLQDNIDSGYAAWFTWENFWRDVTGSIENANGRAKNLIVNNRPRRLRNG